MNPKLKERAVKLFVEKYGKTPKEAGYPIISTWGVRRFLYATSEKELREYESLEYKWTRLLPFYLIGIVISALVLLILAMTGVYNSVEAYNAFFDWDVFWLEASALFLVFYGGGKLLFRGTVISISF